ncbi:nucleotidyltransferase domain-containing protein [Methylotuvimicrobium buryatense]|uniref:nucleotidyltransferase domain-containing protein n=1 Tax=Methylotuvimicrobium buryatense TaxID=95641 RepID=UPI00191C652F|nr:nucleotidyltransferase domain-containing protein [Methylotuvimicrobium buryatense]
MRLSPMQKQAICESALRYFGKEVQVWLFGSRVDDTRKGGDIDLYIETPTQNAEELITAKLQFLRELHKKKSAIKKSISFCTEPLRQSICRSIG